MLKLFRLKKNETDRNSDPNKGMKGSGSGKCVGKCKRFFFSRFVNFIKSKK